MFSFPSTIYYLESFQTENQSWVPSESSGISSQLHRMSVPTPEVNLAQHKCPAIADCCGEAPRIGEEAGSRTLRSWFSPGVPTECHQEAGPDAGRSQPLTSTVLSSACCDVLCRSLGHLHCRTDIVQEAADRTCLLWVLAWMPFPQRGAQGVVLQTTLLGVARSYLPRAF